MSSKTSILVVVVGCALGAGAKSVEAADLFWTVTDTPANSIEGADLDGTNQVTLYTDTQLEPRDIALDAAAGKLYFNNARSSGTANKIMRMNLDGTVVEDLVLLGAAVPNFLELDLIRGKMFWMQSSDIHRANLDGSADEVVFTISSNLTKGFAIDALANKMYWMFADAGDTRIRNANLDGTNDADVLTMTGDVSAFGGFTVSGGKIYWSHIFAPNFEIRRVNVDGSGLTVLWSSPDLAVIFRTFVDEANGFIYWTNSDSGVVPSIRRADLDGTGVVDLVTAAVGLAFVDVAVPVSGAGIPTVSQWGLATLALCLATAGTIAFRLRQAAIA